MMAMGVTPGRLTKMLLMESMAITLIGILSGMALGAAVTWYFQANGIDLSGQSDFVAAIRHTAAVASAPVMALGPWPAPRPYWRSPLSRPCSRPCGVRKLRPVEALTHV